MPDDTTNVDAVLSEVEMHAAETPARLRERAQVLDAEFAAAVMVPLRVAAESAMLRARAAAMEVAEATRVPVAEAEAVLAGAEARYEATAGPEQQAATRCTKARHLFEKARDDLEQARQNGEEPARLVELDIAATSTAKVDQWEDQALSDAQAARGAARQGLDAARAMLTRARQSLDRAEAAVASPHPGELAPTDLYQSLLFVWPYRVLTAGQGDSPELAPAEFAVCRLLASTMCDRLGVIPEGAARRARDLAREDQAKLAGALNQMSVVLPDGRSVNAGQALRLPSGMAGR